MSSNFCFYDKHIIIWYGNWIDVVLHVSKANFINIALIYSIFKKIDISILNVLIERI